MRERPSPENPCLAHDCHRCCTELEAPLTEVEAARLARVTGKAPQEFTFTDDEGVLQLSKRDGRCVFLGTDGLCTVHADRPAGCRLYPFVHDRLTGGVTRDEMCPYAEEFAVPPSVEAEITAVLAELRHEAAKRKA